MEYIIYPWKGIGCQSWSILPMLWSIQYLKVNISPTPKTLTCEKGVPSESPFKIISKSGFFITIAAIFQELCMKSCLFFSPYSLIFQRHISTSTIVDGKTLDNCSHIMTTIDFFAIPFIFIHKQYLLGSYFHGSSPLSTSSPPQRGPPRRHLR